MIHSLLLNVKCTRTMINYSVANIRCVFSNVMPGRKAVVKVVKVVCPEEAKVGGASRPKDTCSL